MAFDGAFLHTLLNELSPAEGARVEKIYEPSRDEIVLYLKKKDFVGKLLITARNGSARIGFTETSPENPQTPPMFCMLARKIYGSARFTGAVQPGLERVLELNFEAVNELGDIIKPKIICEFISGGNNIILADENNKIFDAINRSDITAARLIMPGAVYEYPESRGKLNIFNADNNDIISAVAQRGAEVSAALLSVCDGLSPLVCREACFLAFGDTDIAAENADLKKLSPVINNLRQSIGGAPCYTVLYEGDTPKEFCFTDVLQYGSLYRKKGFDSASKMLDAFYAERDNAARLKKQSGDLLKTVNNALSRTNRRMNLRIKDLEAARDREKYRIYGELLKANIHAVKPGAATVSVQNFYDENLSEITIELDPALSPAANAAKYFKEYKKSCAACQNLGALIDADKVEIEYLSSVLYSLQNARDAADIADIREELIVSGYIKRTKTAQKRKSAAVIEEHISPEGYRILVGHNNIQNDYITTRVAEKSDVWFHVKNIPGSHVVVKCGGRDLSEQTVMLAARLAAQNSKAQNSSNVPVDYTPVKYVKKPAGAKAGMVIYTTNKTVYVTPWEE